MTLSRHARAADGALVATVAWRGAAVARMHPLGSGAVPRRQVSHPSPHGRSAQEPTPCPMTRPNCPLLLPAHHSWCWNLPASLARVPLRPCLTFAVRSLHWEPKAPGSDTVRFTLRTAWERTAGVYTQIVDGLPKQLIGTGMYQPQKGDRVKVVGPETPKFIVSNGLFSEYLELTVTSNTEQVLDGEMPGQNLPHQDRAHWSYEGTNFFEGISEWEVKLDDPSKTYVAEFQGCCRVSQMAPMQNKKGCIETRYGRGILQLCQTPYFLRATVNLQFVPPPVSFLPQIVPNSFLATDGTFSRPMELPILDYRTTRKGLQRIQEQDTSWPKKISTDESQAGGTLYQPASVAVEDPIGDSDTVDSKPSNAARRLLAQEKPPWEMGGQTSDVDLEPIPKLPKPSQNKINVTEALYQVRATAAMTGVSLRMLEISPEEFLKLYSGSDCSGDTLNVPPGSDICDHSFVDMKDCFNGHGRIRKYKCFAKPDGNPSSVVVLGNVKSIRVPEGINVQFSDKCEVSDPFSLDQATVLGQCDNSGGSGPKCCNVTSAHVRAFRATRPSAATKCVTQDGSCVNNLASSKHVHDAVAIEYGVPSTEEQSRGDNIVTTLLKRPEAPKDLTEGNFPVTLLVGTSTSGTTMVEFILKVLVTAGDSQIQPEIGGVLYDALNLEVVNIPTNFEYTFRWQFTGKLSRKNVFFHSLDAGSYLFNGEPHVVNHELDTRDPESNTDDIPGHGSFTWSPCLFDAGMYYYCMSAVSVPQQDFSGADYAWGGLRCVKLRVSEDLPPKISFYYQAKPFIDQSTYSLYMGQGLEVVVNASDNFQDEITFLGISKISTNTGDELRARVTYVYENVDRAYQDVAVAKMPKIVQPNPPSFLNLHVGGPTNETLSKERLYQAERMVSFFPTRMHSGLQFAVCFISVDSRGMCSKLGDWSERCMHVSVERFISCLEFVCMCLCVLLFTCACTRASAHVCLQTSLLL